MRLHTIQQIPLLADFLEQPIMPTSTNTASAAADATDLELRRLVDEYNKALSQGDAPFNIERVAHLYKRDAEVHGL